MKNEKHIKNIMPGRELGRLLDQANMSRRALGRSLGIADSTVGRWIDEVFPIGRIESVGLVSYFKTAYGIDSKWKPTIRSAS